MSIPTLPPLNARTIAAFATSRPSQQRTTLRRYARPPKQQSAPIVMYDPVRKVLSEYFRSGRDPAVLRRVVSLLESPSNADTGFAEKRRKSNRSAIAHLGNVAFDGDFTEIERHRVDIVVQNVRVKATTDFYATFVPANKRMKARRVGVIINPSGIPRNAEADIQKWWEIECEIALRSARANNLKLDEVDYVNLRRESVHKYTKERKRLWADIDATCERILREWTEIRIETSGDAAEA